MGQRNKGLDYLQSGDVARALKFLSRDKSPAGLLNYSAALYAANRFADGKRVALAAGDWNLAYNNVGLCDHKLNKPLGGLEWFMKAGDLGYVDGYFNAACSLLRNDFNSAEGWRLYEKRFSRSNPVGLSLVDPAKRWDGVSPGRVLVLAEQGFGDCIMFSGLVDKDWTLQTFAETREFFDYAGFKTTLVSDVEHDWWIPICSLGGLRKFSGQPWVKPLDIEKKYNVGYVYKGDKKHVNDHNRSSTERAFKNMLRGIDGVVSLQYGENPEISSWLDTVRAVSECKLVVTVDTSVAHICGAMGIPCIVLLPEYDVDFRWGHTGNKVYYYPSVTLVRKMDYSKARDLILCQLQSADQIS